MASTFWIMIGTVAIMAVIIEGVVRIIREAKSGGGRKSQAKMSELEQKLVDLQDDLLDARERIVVLEKIVTDGKYDLGRQIDDLKDQQA